jgi:hypothetical protein
MAESQRPLLTFADRLNFLFETVHPPGRRPYSDEEVAAGISGHDQDGVSVSATYIRMLRTGRRDNPTIKHPAGLARFFGVPSAYFFHDVITTEVAQELVVLRALKGTGAQKLALRTTGLSPKGLESIWEVIDQVRELERLSYDQSEQDAGTR